MYILMSIYTSVCTKYVYQYVQDVKAEINRIVYVCTSCQFTQVYVPNLYTYYHVQKSTVAIRILISNILIN